MSLYAKNIGGIRFLPLILLVLTLAGCTQAGKETSATIYSTLEGLYGDGAFRLTDSQPQPIPIQTVEVDGYILGILYNQGTLEDEMQNPPYFQAFAAQIVDNGYSVADIGLKFQLKDYKWLWSWDLLDHTYRLYLDFSGEAFGQTVQELGSKLLPNGQTVHFGLEHLAQQKT